MKESITKSIVETFNCLYFKITDESHQHHGHKGVDRTTNTHFRLIVVSELFEGQTLVQRQRQVNKACKPYFDQGLHALACQTFTLNEWSKRDGK